MQAAFFNHQRQRETAKQQKQNRMRFGVPLMLIMVPLAWAVLTFLLYPVDFRMTDEIRGIMRRDLTALGPVSSAEKRVMMVFLATVLAWMSRLGVGDGTAVRLILVCNSVCHVDLAAMPPAEARQREREPQDIRYARASRR